MSVAPHESIGDAVAPFFHRKDANGEYGVSLYLPLSGAGTSQRCDTSRSLAATEGAPQSLADWPHYLQVAGEGEVYKDSYHELYSLFERTQAHVSTRAIPHKKFLGIVHTDRLIGFF